MRNIGLVWNMGTVFAFSHGILLLRRLIGSVSAVLAPPHGEFSVQLLN